MESSAITHTTVDAAERARVSFEALGRRDLSKAEELWGPDTVDHFLPVGTYQGTEAIRGYFEELFAAFPDFELEVERIVAEGNTSVVQWHCTGTFNGGSFLGIEPTGRSFRCRMTAIYLFDGTGLVCERVYFDTATILRQLV